MTGSYFSLKADLSGAFLLSAYCSTHPQVTTSRIWVLQKFATYDYLCFFIIHDLFLSFELPFFCQFLMAFHAISRRRFFAFGILLRILAVNFELNLSSPKMCEHDQNTHDMTDKFLSFFLKFGNLVGTIKKITLINSLKNHSQKVLVTLFSRKCTGLD